MSFRPTSQLREYLGQVQATTAGWTRGNRMVGAVLHEEGSLSERQRRYSHGRPPNTIALAADSADLMPSPTLNYPASLLRPQRAPPHAAPWSG
jgi:hypothetical protein